ncbi:type II/IV secretion system ATPase subunit [Methanocalculus sp. MC3]
MMKRRIRDRFFSFIKRKKKTEVEAGPAEREIDQAVPGWLLPGTPESGEEETGRRPEWGGSPDEGSDPLREMGKQWDQRTRRDQYGATEPSHATEPEDDKRHGTTQEETDGEEQIREEEMGRERSTIFSFLKKRQKPEEMGEQQDTGDDLEDLVEELIAATHEDDMSHPIAGEETSPIPEEKTPTPWPVPDERPGEKGGAGDPEAGDIRHKPPHPIPLQEVVIEKKQIPIPEEVVIEKPSEKDEPVLDGKGSKKPSILQRLSPKRRLREEYHPDTHGPLLDLRYTPPPGVEEVELYPVHPPYAYIRILYDVLSHEYTYQVIEPLLTEGEEALYNEIKNRLFETLDISTRGLSREETRKLLREASRRIIEDFDLSLTPVEEEKIHYRMDCEFIGDGLIDPIMHDPFIEDISCDGLKSPIFVYHTRYESIKTSLCYTSSVDLDSFVTKLAQRAGKYISIAEPILDATMSDGSRIQMTLGTEVTAHGSTFTIRKFRDEPITPTDLIEWKTFSPLSIAFLWLAVESGKSCIFAGGTASGKTTSLNAISLFMPPLAKIITLEDTRELKLPHANWIPSVTRDSFDTGGRGEIDLYELLRAALRQRPEYLLVGEVRGREALTLFQAMSTGHITYSTTHADSVSSVVHRLENPPMNVPRNMLSALDLVSIQVQARVGGQRIRRNKQIIEILDIDPRTNELITNEVFRWKPSTDEISYSGKSYILEDIMEERGWDDERIQEELKRRQEVLEWMRIRKIRHYKDVSAILMDYFRNPDDVIARVRGDLYEQV